jgi:hypothetical protein
MAAQVVEQTLECPIAIDDDAAALLDTAGHECIEDFSAWAHAEARRFGVVVTGVRVRRWRSLETPEWEQLVVDVNVTGDSSSALRFWEAASGVLEELVHRHPSPVTELLAEQVHWR